MNKMLASGAVTMKGRTGGAHSLAVPILAMVAVGSFALLIVLVALLRTHHGDHLNMALLLSIHQGYNPLGGKAAAWFSRLFEPALLAALGLVVAGIAWSSSKVWSVTLAGVAVVATGSTLVLKALLHEARPQLFIGPIAEKGYSFPSGHTLVATALLPLLAAFLARFLDSRSAKTAVWVLGCLLPLWIGFDRVYLGLHWPGDVAGGFLGGLALACCGFIALLQADKPARG